MSPGGAAGGAAAALPCMSRGERRHGLPARLPATGGAACMPAGC